MFGRRKRGEAARKESEALRGTPVDPHAGRRDELPRPEGPWDIEDVDLEAEDADEGNRVDLGGLVVTGGPGLELRLQVDQQAQAVAAVLLVAAESALELRAFAAPRTEDIWDEVRREIAADASRRGGTATEQDGPYGTELRLAIPATAPDGRQGAQVSRIVGVSAPRWLLRGTFLGKEAMEPSEDSPLDRAFRKVVVRRGDGPMAPRAPIPLKMPPGVAPATPEQQA